MRVQNVSWKVWKSLETYENMKTQKVEQVWKKNAVQGGAALLVQPPGCAGREGGAQVRQGRAREKSPETT